jgi:hypothetical protein
MKEGFAWGLGQSAAHAIINRVLTPAVISESVETKVAQKNSNSEYEQCIKEFKDEAGCKHLLQG